MDWPRLDLNGWKLMDIHFNVLLSCRNELMILILPWP